MNYETLEDDYDIYLWVIITLNRKFRKKGNSCTRMLDKENGKKEIINIKKLFIN